MATKDVSCFLFLLSTCFTITAIAVASPPPSSSPPSPSCSDKIMSMMDCLDYIQEGSNASSPAAKCCDELKSVVSTSPGCLCEGFRMASDLGIKIDMARALKMPQACSVPLPPGVGNCTVTPAPAPAPVPGAPPSSPPVTSPVPAPAPAPPVSPPSPSTPSPAPSKPPTPPTTAPPVLPPVQVLPDQPTSPSPSTSGSLRLTSSLLALCVTVAVASFSYL